MEDKGLMEWYEKNFKGCGGDTLPIKDGKGGERKPAVFSKEEVPVIPSSRDKTDMEAFYVTAFAMAVKAYTVAEQIIFTISDGIPLYLTLDPDKRNEELVEETKAFIENARSLYATASDEDKSSQIPDIKSVNEKYDIKGSIRFGLSFADGTASHGISIQDFSEDKDLLIYLHVTYKEGIGIVTECCYDESSYSEYTIRGLLKLFINISGELEIKEKGRDICLVTAEDEKAILDLYDTDVAVEYKPAYRMLQDAADKYPDRTALIAVDRRLTYRELNEEANAVGHVLKDMGAGVTLADSMKEKNGITAVLADRNSYAYVMREGVLKSGGAFLPIDPEYPVDRIKFILEDSGAHLLITTAEIHTRRKDLFEALNRRDTDGSTENADAGTEAGINEIKVICVEDALREGKRDNLNAEVPESALAYIIYTSGSTGRPKGVMLKNSNLVNFVDYNGKNTEMFAFTGKGSVSVSIAPFTFDVSILEEFAPYARGNTNVLATMEQFMDADAMRDLIINNNVEIMTCTPTYLLNMIEIDAFKPAVKYFKSLDVGAEAFPPVLFEKLIELNPDLYIVNTYGPTEATVSATLKKVENADDITIGKPLANVKMTTLDREGRLQPPGAMGELVIMGAGVGQGYIGRDDLTERNFIKLLGLPAYRSGDLVRIREDGDIDFHGRMDNQVKLRGLRVELGEIESVISSYPGVRSSVVIVAKGETDYLAAYFTADSQIDIAELKKYLSEKLTDYMVPQSYLQMDEMPLTANGKVDKKALPEPGVYKEEIIPPQNEMQRKILDAATEVIPGASLGINTDLYGAGLSSIGCIRFCALLTEKFGVNYKVPEIFENRTVKDIEELTGDKLSDSDTGAVNYELRDEYPLSMTQTGIYIECERYPDSTIYNIPELFTLDPSVDTERLEKAVRTAVEAHPYLLMQPVMDEKQSLHARRRDDFSFEIKRISCIELPAEDLLVRPFDLKSGEQLFRAEIYETEDKNYFFFDTHHIVSDGGSIDILINDIEKAYQGETVSREDYTGYEFALDEEAARKSSRLERARSWYDGIFRGCGGETLPGKDGTPDASHIAFHRIYGEANGAGIRKWCEDNSLTYNAFFTAAFGLALTAYTCSEQAVFCTIYNGRNDVRLENSVSMLVKTMPVFLSPDKDKKVEEYIEGCQNYLLSAMSNDIFSFAEIRKAYDIKADILFAFQGEFEHGAVIGGKNASLTMLGLSHARAPLGVDITFDGNSVVYEIEYDPTLFSEYTVRGLITMTDTVASQMLIKEKIGDIALVTDREKEKIQNLYDSSYPVEERPAYRLLQDASDKYPDRKALVAVDRTLTFRELNEEANALGHVLAGLGAGPESIVAVLAQRNSHAYVMRQGVLKSGGAFLPIDPEYPEDRIRFILEDSGARLLVTTKDVLTERKTFFDELATTGITIVEEGTAVNKGNRENLNVSVPYESLAYVIYTSGSTGRPKGVMLTNKNLVNFVDDNEKNHEIQGYTKRGHVSLAIAALTFDFSIMEEFVPIANGLTVVLATHDQIMNPVMLAQAMLDNDVDVMSCTPSYLMNLLDMGEYTDIFNRAVKKLKSVDMGAEAFPPALFDKLKAVNPDIYIMNGYGPTEATISCTMQVIENTDDITIGIPNVNVSVCTIDRDLRLQPMGALGEMVIVGDGIGRGYIGRDDLTAKSFITMFGKPAYRSGDLVRLKEDGNIEFHGRIDNQVKLRGLRVELGEIESVINTYPGVRSSIVIVVKQETEYLAAYFTADNRVDLSDLKTHLAAKLTEYMVPQVFMQLDEMPLTANGKIDKKALPQAGLVEDKITEPENEMQEEITGAVKEVLGDVRFGVDSDLFGAGLSSIGCIRLCAILSGRFEVNILISDIFDNKTVREIESLIYEKRDNEVQDYTIREEYPLTMTQMGIFVESIKFTGSTVYNIPYLYKLDEATDMMRLKSAVEKALTAHPYIFMTLRRTEDDEVVAVRKNAGEITVNVPVESVLPPKDELVRPYDLISGEALYRISLYDTKDGKYIFIDLHHIIGDGESFDILLSDIDSAYNGEEPEAETYTGYEAALDEKNARRSGRFKTAKDWLESTFDGCGGVSVPEDRGVIAGAEASVASIAPDSVYADEHIGTVKYTGLSCAEKVRSFCSEHDLTENAFFTAAFGLALKIYTGRDDAVFTTIYNGRSDPRTQRSIAMYVKTLPVLLSLNSNDTTVGAVEESRSLLLNAMANDVVSFSEIRTEYGIDSDVLFAYQGDLGTSSVETPYTGEKIKIGEGNAEEIELSLSQAKALFGLDISLKGNGIVYEFEYDPSAYRRETMDSFVSLLDHIVSLLITKERLSEIFDDGGVKAFIPEKSSGSDIKDKAAKDFGTEAKAGQGAGNGNTAGSEDLIQEFCEIFKKVLSLDKVERDSDFFKLGGTSLTAAKVMMASMSRNLPVVYQDVFDNPTPEKLAIMVEEKQRAEFGSGNTAGEAAVEMDLRAVSKGENGPLAHNCDEYLDRIALGHGEYRITGNVVVTGAAGFLGIHVLKELLESDAPEIYCLINGRGEDAKEKLKQTFFYYFEGAHNEELDKRITVVDGDITSPESLVELEKYDFIMLINCAACVKHFAKADMMKQVNVYGVGNLADLCIKKGAKLIHVSTTSIAGDCVGEGNHPEVLDETRLSMGQEVESNIYVYTKYLAEKLVIDAVEKKGLDAKIMRVGNLMSRHEDGEFQINFETNNFMNTLRAYQVLGCYPVDLMHEQDEFSPIDEVARAILLLASTPSEFTIFHPYNSHSVEMGDIVYAMNNAGINIDIVERSEFDTRLKEALADDNKNRYVSPLVNYDLDDDERRVENGADNIFTVRALYRLGFKWSLTDAEYIRHSIEMLDSLDFFEDLV